MAYVASYMTEEDRKREEAAGRTATARPTSGVVDSSTPTGTAPAGGAAAAAPTPGSGFVNLQQYLDQNQGEGARLAGAATAGLVGQVDALKTDAKNTVTTGAEQIKAGAKSDEAKQVIQGVRTDPNAVQDVATSFLGAGYGGPAASDLTAGIATTANDLSGKLATVDDSANVQSSLATTYGTNQPYTGGFGLLDSFLVGGTQSGRDTLAGVKAKGSEVEATVDSAQTLLTEAEDRAKKQLDKNKQAVLSTAKEVKGNTLANLEAEAAKLTASANPNAAGVKAASIGDVIDDEKKADLDALTAILNGDSIDYEGTFDEGAIPQSDTPAGVDIPGAPIDIPPPVAPPAGGGGGGGELPPALDANAQALGAAAKAGADISDAVKKVNEPNVEMIDSLGNFITNPTPEAAMDLLKKAGIAPFATAYNAIQLATDLTRQLKGRAVEDLNRAFPGIGPGLGDVLDMGGGKLLDVVNPQLPDLDKIKIPQNDLKTKPVASVKVPPMRKPPKAISSADILKKAAAAKAPKVPDWAPKGVDPKLFDSKGVLVGDPATLTAGLSQMELNQLARKLEKAGIKGPAAKAVGKAIADIKSGQDASKAAGKAASDAEGAAKKAATDASNAAKDVANKAAAEAKKLGGKVASEGKKAVNKVKNYVAPRLRRK